MIVECIGCGAKINIIGGLICDRCKKNSIHLKNERYLAALIRFHGAIKNGAPLKYFDHTEIGNKDTQCTWGLCDLTSEMWPDKEDHLWPHLFERDNKASPLYRDKGQMCPMDTREGNHPDGCFYHCRVFQAVKDDYIPTRREALKLYELKIIETREKLGK